MIKPRLAFMMFLEYFIWGGWYVTVGTWLSQRLHFSGSEVGLVAGATAVGAIVSPFLAGWVADRFLATQIVLAILHGSGAVLLWFAAGQTHFGPLYVLVLIYAICYMPTLSLTNSLAFRHLKSPEKEFGSIRVAGTIGWIVAGLLIGALRVEDTMIPMRIAAASSLAMGLFCLILPNTPPVGAGRKFGLGSLLPREALGLFRERSFSIFVLASFFICIPLQFYYALTNLYLNQSGVAGAAAKMTGGQMSELFCMLLIPWFFRRLGVKYMLAAGMLAWVVRYVFFAMGNAGSGVWMLWLGILLHGICYDFFFVTGQIYVDRKSPPAFRAAAQGMVILITYGAGMLVGSWLCGMVLDYYSFAGPGGEMQHHWPPVWFMASGISAVVLLAFLLFFKETPTDAVEPIPRPDVAHPLTESLS